MKINLRLNSEIQYLGRNHMIVGLKGNTVVLQRSEGNLETHEYNLEQIISDAGFRGGHKLGRKEKEGEFEIPLDKLDKEKRDEVSWKYNLILPVLLLEKLKNGDVKALIEFNERFNTEYLNKNENIKSISQEELIKRILKKLKKSNRSVSRSTFMRYLNKYRNYQKTGVTGTGSGIECFIRSNDKEYIQRADTYAIEICSPRNPDEVVDIIYTKYPVEYHPIIKSIIENKYLTTRKLKVSKINEILETDCGKAGLKKMPYITVRSLIKQLRERTVSIFRHGRKGIEAYTPTERGYSEKAALYPLHIVQIDHTKLDIIAVSEVSGQPIGRPFITLGIDVYSRTIWCMHLSFDDPSSAKVRKAIIQGLFCKRSKERYSTTNEWPIFGVPSVIYLDNGSDFTSDHVKKMIDETLESEVRYRPRKTPHYGGVIERLMGSINSLLSELPGYTGSNIIDKGDRDPSSEACLTLKQIEQFVSKWIVDVYHFKEHKGLPLECNVPILRYQTGCEEHGNPDFFPPENEEIISLSLLPTSRHPYTRFGITMDHIEYKADNLSHLIGKREIKYNIKYDDDDLTCIYFQLPGTGEYLTVPAVYPSTDVLEGLNRYEWHKVKDDLRAKGLLSRKNKMTDALVEQGRKELREMVEKTYTQKKTSRKMSEKIGFDFSTVAGRSQTQQSTSKKSIESLLQAVKQKYSQRS
ncbi:Transposon Tn7 transposition protein TnsB [compost metagenome]